MGIWQEQSNFHTFNPRTRHCHSVRIHPRFYISLRKGSQVSALRSALGLGSYILTLGLRSSAIDKQVFALQWCCLLALTRWEVQAGLLDARVRREQRKGKHVAVPAAETRGQATPLETGTQGHTHSPASASRPLPLHGAQSAVYCPDFTEQ